jgi:hypothetical protein
LEAVLAHFAPNARFISPRALAYTGDATLNGVTTRACELMRFDANGRQTWGEALYGAPV